MKESERRKKELDELPDDTNDYKVYRKIVKYEKALKYEEFEEKWLPKFKTAIKTKSIKKFDDGFKFDTTDKQFFIYYPKSNKLFIGWQKRWITYGLNYLKKVFDVQ